MNTKTKDEKTSADKQPTIGKPFLPGQSGNPAGRPPGKKYISEAMREYLEANPGKLKEMVQAAVDKSLEGDIMALKEIADRTEGKVKDELKLTGEILVSHEMRVLAAREMLEVKTEESKLLEGNDG